MRHDPFSGALSCALAIALSALVSAAHAADEHGGTRSVFAAGAGSRALAMGGAYVAVSDDASAAFWNPGGLGLVPRLQLEAFHASRERTGFSESAIVLAAPSWRWGSGAVSIRHFGATGIERRDERNVLLGETEDAESELGFSYGRRIGPWAVGGTFRLQRQSLDGFSATGLGADVGVLVRADALPLPRAAWLERLSLGLTARNALEPRLRLAQDDVADPATVRAGLAWRHDLAGGRSLLAALDLETSRAVDPRLHAGVEARLHPLLALRAGLDGGRLAAGTRLTWREVSLDYAWREEDGTSVQHLGLSTVFGKTVAESRAAAVEKEERQMQARLDRAFEARLAAQVDDVVTRASAAAAQERFDEAIELLATATLLDPNRPDLAEHNLAWLRARATQLEQAGDWGAASGAWARVVVAAPGDSVAAAAQRRCQDESDRRTVRSAALRARYAAALQALAKDDLLAARAGFEEIVAAEPGDRDAAALLARTRQAIAERVAGLLAQAERRLDAGDRAGAEAALARARRLDPRAQGLAALESALERPRATTALRTTAAEIPAPASPARRREVEDLYRRGVAAMSEGRGDDALRYWELVRAMDPAHGPAGEMLEREYLVRGMDAFGAGRYEQAIAVWEKAQRIDPDDPRTLGYLARAQTQLERTRRMVGTPPK
jgi:tetratricopeptide (TPR) repeat protein